MATSHQAYDELQKIIERHGGTMTYQREGFIYGAWVISLNDKSAAIEAPGNQSFPELDELYVPKIVKPTRWEHRHNILLDDAEEHLLAMLK